MKYYADKGRYLFDKNDIMAAGADFDPDNEATTEYFLKFRFHLVDCPDGEGLLWGMWMTNKWGVICRDDSEKGVSIHYFAPELINLTDKSFDPPDDDDDRLPWVPKAKRRKGKAIVQKVDATPVKKREDLFYQPIRV